MVFIETPTFTKSVLKLLDDESYGALQLYLAEHPGAVTSFAVPAESAKCDGQAADEENAADCG